MKKILFIFCTLITTCLALSGCQELDEPMYTIPKLTTNEATDITINSAYLSGTSNRNVSGYFLVSTSEDMSNANRYSFSTKGGQFYCNVKDLKSSTIYYAVPCAHDDWENEVRGNVITFTTLDDVLPYVSTKSINFGTELASSSFTIMNEGKDDMNWEIKCEADWLICEPKSGTLAAGQKASVIVTIVREKMTQDTQKANIVIKTNGGNRSISVSATIPRPNLYVPTSTIDFGSIESTSSFYISNEGNTTLNWSINSSVKWLSYSETKGKLAVGEGTYIYLELNRSQLPKGDQTATISITSEAGEKTITVTANSNPVLYVEPEYIDFGLENNTFELYIGNMGYSTLNWTMECSQPWIKCKYQEGSIKPISKQEVSVWIDREQLTRENTKATIKIISNGGEKTIHVTATPRIAEFTLSPESFIDFGAEQTAHPIVIYNSGNVPLEWSAKSSESWLTISETGGVLSPTNGREIQLIVDRESLTLGSHNAEVTFYTSEAGTKTIKVSVRKELPITEPDTEVDEWNNNNGGDINIYD